jgi:hypothetical protein
MARSDGSSNLLNPDRLVAQRHGLSRGLRALAVPGLSLWLGCTGSIMSGPSTSGSGNGNSSNPGGGPSGGEGSNPGSNPGGGPNTSPGGPPPPAPANSVPGIAQLRRLTLLEYRNTVRDLLGLTDARLPELSEDQQARGSGFTTGAAITTASDARKLFDGTESLVTAAMPNLTGQVPCLKDANAGEPCAREFITGFGRRAFRRPLIDDEVKRWLDLYKAQREPAVGATFTEAIRGVAMALLQSPNFLYRRELAPGAAIKDGNFIRFNSYEMASRLSYAFWASMPDDKLFQAAETGKLTSAQAIQNEARRLLADPKAKDVYADFATQWLNLGPVVFAQKGTDLNFTAEIGKAMLAETGAFMADVFSTGGNGKLDQLLTSKRSFVNETLANLYGIKGVTGSEMKAVDLDGSQRAGLLTQLTFLTMHGDSEGSFPTRRGAQMMRRLFCTEIEPPQNMDIPDIAPPSPGVTTRQRFEQHLNNPCAGCHRLLDPLGFAFEHYDGVGRYRTMDNNQPVDASGTLELRTGPVKFKDAVELMPALAGSEEVRSCLPTQWMRYMLRREELSGDKPSLTAIEKAFHDSGYDMRELLVAIVSSDAFTRRAPAAEEVLP